MQAAGAKIELVEFTCVDTGKLGVRMYVVKRLRVFEESHFYKCFLHRTIPPLRETIMTDDTKIKCCVTLVVTQRNSAEA